MAMEETMSPLQEGLQTQRTRRLLTQVATLSRNPKPLPQTLAPRASAVFR